MKNFLSKKTITIFSICLLFVSYVNAQEANKFRVDFGLGYAIPSDGGGGILINLEPKWNIADDMSIGLRFASALMARNIETDGETVTGDLNANGSYVATFDKYFNNGSSSFAPFVGAGVGYYAVGGASLNADAAAVDLDGKIGGLLRAGFDLGKFRLAAEYNLIGASEVTNTNNETVDLKNGYFGISLGFFVGGGKWGR